METAATVGIAKSFLFKLDLKVCWLRKDIPQDVRFVKASFIMLISVLKNLLLRRTGRRKPQYNIISVKSSEKEFNIFVAESSYSTILNLSELTTVTSNVWIEDYLEGSSNSDRNNVEF